MPAVVVEFPYTYFQLRAKVASFLYTLGFEVLGDCTHYTKANFGIAVEDKDFFCLCCGLRVSRAMFLGTTKCSICKFNNCGTRTDHGKLDQQLGKTK